MAFSRADIVQGQRARSTQLLQLIEALEGDSGKGQPILLTSLSSSSARALDVRNLGTGGALRVIDSAGATVLDISDTAYTISPTSGTNLSISMIGAGVVDIAGGSPSGGSNVFTITGGAPTAQIAERATVILSAYTVTITGGYTNQRFTRFMAPTVTSTSVQTITNGANVYISGAVGVGGSAAITNNYSLWVDDGVVRLDNRVLVNGGNASTISNAQNVSGVTVSQGASDDEILSFKSTDVTHGVTGVTETDTYGFVRKAVANDGGLEIYGLGEAATAGMLLRSLIVTATTGARSTTSNAATLIDGVLKSGTTVASLGADANILAVADNGTRRFFLDSDGDSHQDVGTAWTNFDDYDDVGLLSLLRAHVSRQDDPLRKQFAIWLQQNQESLEKIKLVTFNEDQHHFVNMSRLTMLLVGAACQLGSRVQELERLLGRSSPQVLMDA